MLFANWTPPSFAQDTRPETLDRLKPLPGLSREDRPDSFRYRQNDDVGLVRQVRKYPPPPTLSFITAQDFFYADNVYLSETGRKSSAGWSGWFAASYVPWSTYRWTPRVTLEQYLFRHASESPRDFDSQALTFASQFDLNEKKTWTWTLSYALERLNDAHGTHREFYKHGELENQIEWYRPLNQDGSVSLAVSYALAWRHVSPSFEDRIANKASLSLNYYPIGTLRLRPFVRAEVRFYPTDLAPIQDRRDVIVEGGASVTWAPLRNFQLSATASWTRNHSSVSGLNYDLFLPIVGVAGSVSF